MTPEDTFSVKVYLLTFIHSMLLQNLPHNARNILNTDNTNNNTIGLPFPQHTQWIQTREPHSHRNTADVPSVSSVLNTAAVTGAAVTQWLIFCTWNLRQDFQLHASLHLKYINALGEVLMWAGCPAVNQPGWKLIKRTMSELINQIS